MPRRVVIAADVAESALRAVPDVERAAVLVTEPVALSRVVSAHVDDDSVREVIVQAVGSVWRADAGDEDASFIVDEAQSQELQWYATQELRDLVVAMD